MIPITSIIQSYGNKNNVDFTNTLKIVEQNRESRNETIHLNIYDVPNITNGKNIAPLINNV